MVAGHFHWCTFKMGLNLSRTLLAVLPRVPCPLDLRRPLLPLRLGLTPILSVTAASEILSYWILAVEVVSTRPTCSFHPLLSADSPLPHNRRPPCDLPDRSSSQDPKLCHKRSFRDHASDWSFPHVQWQPLVSEHKVSALWWQIESFHRAGIQLTHELHGQERVLAMLHCRTHRCRFRLPLSSMQAERRKNSWRSHQQDFLEPSRACRCSSSCSPSFWHKSPGLLYSMRKSNYH